MVSNQRSDPLCVLEDSAAASPITNHILYEHVCTCSFSCNAEIEITGNGVHLPSSPTICGTFLTLDNFDFQSHKSVLPKLQR